MRNGKHQPHGRHQDESAESCFGSRGRVPAGRGLGFIPGITTNYAALGFAGHESAALLLGVFQVSVLHNVVHLLFGVLGLLMARTAKASRNYLLFGGIVYLVLWVYGLLVGHDTPVNFVPVNNADNWLHLVLGIAMIALALLLSRSTDKRAPATR